MLKINLMKKTTTLTLFLFVLTLAFSFTAEAQKFAKMDVSPMDAAVFPTSNRTPEKLIRIIYGRPQLKGREVSSLAQNGKVWRTGANEAAELTLYTDMKVGGTTVKAGTYTFYTIPGDNEWTAIINKATNVWGAYSYDQTKDVVRVKVPCTNEKESIEAFSIAFDEAPKGVDMYLGWGTVRVKVPFSK